LILFYNIYRFKQVTHVPKDEVDKAKKELPENQFAQEYMADFRKTEDLVKRLEDKRRMAITHITEEKMEKSAIRDLVSVVDMFTKNIQLLTGKETDRTALTLEISEAIAQKNNDTDTSTSNNS